MEGDTSSITLFKRLGLVAGGLLIVLGLTVLVGWAFDVTTLKSVWLNFATMKANTAVCFVLTGAALCLSTLTNAGDWRWNLVRIFALAVLVIGALSLAEEIFTFDAGIDQLMVRDLASTRAPGRMSPATAFNWIAVGLALLLMATGRTRWRRLVQWPALLVALVALIAVAGHIYNVQQLYTFGPYASVALHTALGFLIVSAGLLCVPPHGSFVSLLRSPRLGGKGARMLLPLVTVLPLVGGWLRLEAQRAGWVGTDVGTALFATGLVVMLIGLVWATARAIEFIDTRRERAVDAFRESELSYRTLVESASDGIFITTGETRFLDANSAGCRMLGYTLAELITLTAADIFTEAEVARVTPELERLQEREVVRSDWLFLRKDGSTFPGEVSATILPDGRVLAIVRDVTERKQAEAALRESEARLRLSVEAANVGLWDWDLETNEVYYSPEWKSQIGYRENELANDFTEWTSRVHPDDREPTLEKVREYLANPRGRYEAEFRLRHKDGSYRWIYTHADVVRQPDGKPERMLGCHIDVTERKQAEVELIASTEQLRALSARLLAAREEEGTRIAREIHDELGGVLTGLKWDIEDCEKALSAPGKAEPLITIRQKIPVMTGLLDTTLQTVRRISSELRPGVLDDLGLVAAIEWQAQQFQQRTGIECCCESGLEMVELKRERATAVFRVFQEILTNVLRHAQATLIKINMRDVDNQFVLQVNDNGRGISESDQKNTRSLGLLGMRERVQLIGGQIEISGAPGKGTTVVVTVPFE